MIHKDVRVRKIFLGIGALVFIITIVLAITWYTDRHAATEPTPFREQRIVVGCTDNFPPFDLRDKNGDHIGYARDISTEVARELGYTIEYKTSPHWAEVVEWLKNGEVDLIHLIAYSPERDEYFDFTIPHTPVPEVIFVRSERLDIHGLDDLEGKQIGAVRQHITHEKLLKHEGLDIIVFETPDEGIEALLDGKVDAFAYPQFVFEYLVQQMGREDELKIVGEPIGTLRYGMAVREGDHVLLSHLDHAIQQIEASGKRDEIAQHWFGRKVFLGLTREEVLSLIGWAVFGLLVISISGSAYISIRYRLRKAEAVLRHNLIFQHMDDSVILTSLDGKITDWNPGAERMFGHSREEILGGRLDFLLAPEGSTKLFETIIREVQNEGIWSGETCAVRKDGSLVTCSVKVTALRDEKGDITAYVSILRDITERKKAEEELAKHREHLEEIVKERTAEVEEAQKALLILLEDVNLAKEELQVANIQLLELDRLKSMFIASMSHELRTPLNSIIGFTGIILQGMSGEITKEQRKQLTMVKNSANHLLNLINDIIDLSKIEAGKVELYIEEFDLPSLVQEVKDSFAVIIKEKDLELNLNVSEKLEIKTDERRVKQVLVNLIGNAVKFTEEGRIDIIGLEKNGNVEISVNDTGIGIKKEDMDKLFKAFSQIYREGKVKEGTGLGLYLSKMITGMLGGRIWAESEGEGSGSRFIFTLPLKYKEVESETDTGSRGQ